MNKVIIAVVVIALLAGAGYVLSQNRMMQSTTPSETQTTMDQSNPTAMPSTAMESSPSGTASSSASVVELTVTGSNYKFEPATLTVKKGDTVKITFKNSGGMHDFVIDAFNVKTKTIPSGQSETVQFVASKSGTFEYYCAVGNHKQMGMKGTLTVQ